MLPMAAVDLFHNMYHSVDAGLVDHMTMTESAEHVALELAKEISQVHVVHAASSCSSKPLTDIRGKASEIG